MQKNDIALSFELGYNSSKVKELTELIKVLIEYWNKRD